MTPFISYYYDKNPLQSKFYKECSLNLEKQLNYFGYKLISDNINFASMGIEAYDKLNLYKPTFILNKIKELNSSVVWIDADAQIFDSLTEFDGIDDACDIGFATREHDNTTPHASFIYFNNTQGSINFLKLWETQCKEKYHIPYDCTEHCILVELFKEIDPPIRVYNFLNLASISNKTKIRIGISPAGWEYERNKTK